MKAPSRMASVMKHKKQYRKIKNLQIMYSTGIEIRRKNKKRKIALGIGAEIKARKVLSCKAAAAVCLAGVGQAQRLLDET
jgi:hypothetical protein